MSAGAAGHHTGKYMTDLSVNESFRYVRARSSSVGNIFLYRKYKPYPRHMQQFRRKWQYFGINWHFAGKKANILYVCSDDLCKPFHIVRRLFGIQDTVRDSISPFYRQCNQKRMDAGPCVQSQQKGAGLFTDIKSVHIIVIAGFLYHNLRMGPFQHIVKKKPASPDRSG